MRIGVLAEDITDCDAVAEFIRRITGGAGVAGVGVDKAWGKGCARVRTKAHAKLNEFARKGCLAGIIVHDLDRDPVTNTLNDESALRGELEKVECPPNLERLICIPVEELEAWFWSDDDVVRDVGRGKGKAHPSPHLIVRPKERFINLSVGANRKPRYSTNDNKALAEKLDLDTCAKACPAFAQFRTFVQDVVARARRSARL